MRIWYQKSRSVFKHSIQRRRSYKSFSSESPPILDDRSIDHVLHDLLPGQIEDIFEEPVIYNEAAYAGVVVEALNKTVSHLSIPPKLTSGWFAFLLFQIHIICNFYNRKIQDNCNV